MSEECETKENRRTLNVDKKLRFDDSVDRKDRSRSRSTGRKENSQMGLNMMQPISPIKPSQMKVLQEQVRQLERAKESYKDETRELKHQLKRLR